MTTVSRASLLLVAVLVGCTAATDDTLTLPTSHAEAARELKLMSVPPLRQLTREQFSADAQKEANEEADDEAQRQHDTYGRLGFYPKDFDLKGSGAARSDFFVAYYDAETKSVTVVGTPDHSVLVHELVHALQDQHFDLKHVHGEQVSSDEALARDALIEGDARLAEYRDYFSDRGDDPIATLRGYVTVDQARSDALTIFKNTKLPLIFASYAAFAYSFGAAYVANAVSLPQGQWNYARINALFAAGDGPKSTKEIIRAGAPVEPIVDAGLGSLPGSIAAEWGVESVDRLGEWYTYVLLFPALETSSDLTDLAGA
jgi:hypothetical protein